MQAPFIIHDAEVALFPAWEDGMPMTGPAPLRDSVAPYFHCHTAIRWSRSTTRRESSFGDHRGNGNFRPGEISVSVSHPEGVVLDAVGHTYRLPSLRGRYCIVVILWSQEEKQWQRWQFFHVRIATDAFDAGDGNDASSRPLEFIAEHVEFDAYSGSAPPACVPEVLGRVDFLCGPLHVPCMSYDMLTNTWHMTPYSDTGIRITHGEEETNLPYLMWDEQEVSPPSPLPEGVDTSTFSLMQPRTAYVESGTAPHDGIDPSAYLGVQWQRRLYFSVQRQVTPLAAASGTISFFSDYMPGESIVIAGMTYRFIDGFVPPNPYIQDIGYPHTAERLAEVINDGDGGIYSAPNSHVTATWDGDVVTVLAIVPGSAGNDLLMTESSEDLIVSGPSLTGGMDESVGAKNQLLLHHGITLEVNGSPESIEAIEQDQLLHESIAVFRVLDRVYATIGHDRIAVPAIHHGLTPLSTNIFFKLGDSILDDRGWWNLAEPVLAVSGPVYP